MDTPTNENGRERPAEQLLPPGLLPLPPMPDYGPRYGPDGPYVPERQPREREVPWTEPKPPGGSRWREWARRSKRGRTPEEMQAVEVLPMGPGRTAHNNDTDTEGQPR